MSEEDHKTKDFRYEDHPLLRHIQDNIIGHDLVIQGPYGPRKVIYCDYTASGRCLSFIEDYILSNVLPVYANTHSVTGYNARQTCKFRNEARQIIKQCVNCNKNDVLIFTGNGATAAFHKLAWALKMNLPRVAQETVVIVGPYEHHSNTLLWREYGTQVVRIKDSESGYVDLIHLEDELKFWKEKKQYILVTMSAASNVTGILTDTEKVAEIAHRHGALVVFDYASGGPYLKIDMNSSEKGYKDAVILSPHKFVGGPGTPGILVGKKWLFRNSVPEKVGGGTVNYVSRQVHSYVSSIEDREEGGTPDIIGSVRAAIVFQLKQDVGTDIIDAREKYLCRKAFLKLENNPSIYIMGSSTATRIPIFSFITIHHQSGKLIHYNFIALLLNELFGIQSRGGCACAGPYGHDLLGISEPLAKKFMSILSVKPASYEKNGPAKPVEIVRPGFTRFNLPYFYDDEIIHYIIEAVDMVTTHGWKLLPQYSFDCNTGVWDHRDKSLAETSSFKCLKDINFNKKGMLNSMSSANTKMKKPTTLTETLSKAKKIFKEAEIVPTASQIPPDSKMLRDSLPRDKLNLRWFLTPEEAVKYISNNDLHFNRRKRYKLPFKLKMQAVQETSPGNSTDRSTISHSSKTSHTTSSGLQDSDIFVQTYSNKHTSDRSKNRSTLKKRFFSDSDVFKMADREMEHPFITRSRQHHTQMRNLAENKVQNH